MKFDTNCLAAIPDAFCFLGNIAGLCSTAIWLIVLLPQIYKNYARKSVDGLSILWLSANLTAALSNIFFVFRLDLPLFSKISGVYFVLLNSVMFIQFLMYTEFSKLVTPYSCHKCTIAFLSLCCTVWTAVLTIQVLIPQSTDVFGWMAYVLWSIETFPQLFLNMQMNSTEGQSTISIVLVLFGKTSDALGAYSLDMPLQNMLMVYYSSSTAYLNFMQYLLYSKSLLHLLLYYVGLGTVVILETLLVLTLVWRTDLVYLVCPCSVCIAVMIFWFYLRRKKAKEVYQPINADEIVSSHRSNEAIEEIINKPCRDVQNVVE